MSLVTQELIGEMTQRLAAEFSPRQIYLFGSYAWGQPGPHSDLDFMIVVDSSPYTPAKRAFFGYRCLRDFWVPKDIIVRTSLEFDKNKGITVTLDGEVAAKGKLLYERR